MNTSVPIFRQTRVFSGFLVLMLALAAGCSSDDNGVVADIPATVPDQLNYELNQGDSKILSLNQGGGDAIVSSTLLTGTFNRISQAFTLDAMGLAMQVNADFLTAFDTALGAGVAFSDYQLHVLTAAAWVGDGNPTAGEFEVISSSDSADRIRVSVNNTLPGVDIAYFIDGDLSGSDSLTWEAFDAAFDNPGPTPYDAVASFAYNLLRFMYEQGELVILALEFVGENDLRLEETGPIVESCDTFPRPSIPVVPNPGTSTVSWSDVNADNSVGPGDSFFLDFVNCWDDDETDTIDTLFNGGVEFANYTEVVSGGVITRIGFEPSGGPGGIVFGILQITETEDDENNILVFENEMITLTGGFNMVFFTIP